MCICESNILILACVLLASTKSKSSHSDAQPVSLWRRTKYEADLTEDGLLATLKEQLSGFKTPKAVIFLDEMPESMDALYICRPPLFISLAFDGRGVVPSELMNVFETGVKETFRLATKSGLTIRATANHPFYTLQGWRRLDQLESGVELAVLVDGRIVWDQLAEITSAGQEACYDLTVRDTHCFFGNSMLVHNSLEQDADIVMFIYRDEVYAPDSVDRGTAEVIVAKHRNGPTGVARLAFLSHCTLFTSLAKIDGR